MMEKEKAAGLMPETAKRNSTQAHYTTTGGQEQDGMGDTLEVARDYVKRGFSVIPLRRGLKLPDGEVLPVDTDEQGNPILDEGGRPKHTWKPYQKRRPTDDELQTWFGNGSQRNIGIVTGRVSGLAVVDLDSKEAVDFVKSKGGLQAPTVKTGKGFHLYCAFQDGVRNFQKRADLPSIDLRGEGGYVVAPPSVHESGRVYQWGKEWGIDTPLSPLPTWIFAEKPEDKQPIGELYNGVPKGGRNNALARLVGSWVNDGGELEEIIGQALVWNNTNTPPLPEYEVRQTVTSIFEKHHMGQTWLEPQPLAVKVEPQPYPLDALPTTIGAAVEEVAGFVKAPLPLVASSALGAVSLAIQAHADVRRDEILFGPVSLFLLTIADSGERKTQADKMFIKPIQDYQDEQAETTKPDWRKYKAELEAWESKRSGIKDKIRQLAKENKSTADPESALCKLEHEKPKAPRVPKLLREDATPEGLAKKLQKEWPSAGVVSNEAGIVFGAHGMGKDSVMRNLALLNKLWDGGRYQSDRGDEERSRDVRGARLTMSLMIQEATLRAFFDQSKGLARGTGFLARFLVAWPDSTMGTRFYSPPVVGSPALSVFNRRITDLLNQPVPIDDEGVLTPPVLPLTTDAKAAWVAFHDVVERELASGGELHDVRDVASKSADNAARLATLFQIFEHGMGGAVGLEYFEGASRIVAWHLNESRRFFGELALPVELADAARLDTWLIEHCQRIRTHAVGKNHARQYGPLRDAARLDAAVRELSDLERLRLVKEGKQLTIQLNPALVGV